MDINSVQIGINKSRTFITSDKYVSVVTMNETDYK